MNERNETDRATAAAGIAPLVLEVLREWEGRNAALPLQLLAGRVGASERVVRVAITQLQLDGHPVIAETTGGYRMARNRSEMLDYAAFCESYIVATAEKVRAVRATADRLYPPDLQMRMAL